MSDPQAVLEQIRRDGIQTVDFRFTDLRGRWQHFSFAAGGVTEAHLHDGVMFDGSAIAGWRDVSESDMLLKPDLASAVLDPFSAQPSLILLCDVAEPSTGLGYERCPRSLARARRGHLRRRRRRRPRADRAAGGVLRLRRRPLRGRDQRGLLSGRFRGRPLQLGHPLRGRQQRPPAAEGRAARRAAGRPDGGSARRDGQRAQDHGPRPAAAPPRHRASQNQISLGFGGLLRSADAPADLQIRGPQRRQLLRQDRHLPAQADGVRAGLRPADRAGAVARGAGRCSPARAMPT